jgi:hypothetical protein
LAPTLSIIVAGQTRKQHLARASAARRPQTRGEFAAALAGDGPDAAACAAPPDFAAGQGLAAGPDIAAGEGVAAGEGIAAGPDIAAGEGVAAGPGATAGPSIAKRAKYRQKGGHRGGTRPRRETDLPALRRGKRGARAQHRGGGRQGHAKRDGPRPLTGCDGLAQEVAHAARRRPAPPGAVDDHAARKDAAGDRRPRPRPSPSPELPGRPAAQAWRRIKIM